MNAHLATVSGPWPGPKEPNESRSAPSRDPDSEYAAAIAEITSAMSNSRRLALVAGGLLIADIAGVAIAVPRLLSLGLSVGWGSSALLAPVALIWLTAAVFLLQVEQPAAGALGELRRDTGAPTDLSAPWRSVGVRIRTGTDLDWERLIPLIGAATIAHARARRALRAAVVATAGFLLWTILCLALAAVA